MVTIISKNNYTVKLGNWQQLEDSCRPLRETVFIQEQNVPPEMEWDGLDEDCIHAVACDNLGHAIATGRLLPDGHIGRMAVLPEWRNKGVGSTILELLVSYSLQQLGQKPWLDAQVQAVAFYQQHGFETRGKVFTDAGILHRHMYWSNDKQAASWTSPMESPEINQADQSADRIEFTTREQNRDLVCDMSLQARQSIQLFTAKLDNSLYDQSAFIEAVSALAKRSPKSRIQILVRDTSALLKKGHRLIELSRRLASTIQIHNPAVEDCQQIMELLLVDQKGYIHKNHADYYHGEASFNDRSLTREWQRQFAHMWEVSTPDPEIRRLHI